MKKILLIAGTRPNFIKLAPLYHKLNASPHLFSMSVCHTGQHFDFNMSDIFWQNLELPMPDYNLGIKGSGVADSIGKTIVGINTVLEKNKFELIIVFGDVNATVAGAIAAAQNRIPVMHIEAGLRSFDRSMPEEINRVITDHLSDFLMVSEPSGITNLQREGIGPEKIKLAGNIMIECLLMTKHKWRTIDTPALRKLKAKVNYIVCTFHRPENVDQEDSLKRIVEILKLLSPMHPIIFPVHPRTMIQLENYGLLDDIKGMDNVLLTGPLGYFEFLNLISDAMMVLTDSGGIQEETTYLNIPCITFRKNTERPVTITQGTNLLMDIWSGDMVNKILMHKDSILQNRYKPIEFWDDQVSNRIVQLITDLSG